MQFESSRTSTKRVRFVTREMVSCAKTIQSYAFGKRMSFLRLLETRGIVGVKQCSKMSRLDSLGGGGGAIGAVCCNTV